MKKLICLLATFLFTSLNCYAESSAWDNVTRGWSRMPIRVYLQDTGEYSEMIEEGFNDWEKLSDEKVRFKFVTKPHKGYANITVSLVNTFNDTTAGVTKAQMGVNKIYKSRIDIGLHSPDGIKFTEKELAIIIRHEIGHSLGLGHTANQMSIMYPYVIIGQSILPSDIENLLELY